MSKVVKIIILSVIAGLLIALVVWGISARSMIYFQAGRLMFGEQTVTEGAAVTEFEADAQGVRNIRLDFVSESIDVIVTDTDKIRIEEKSSRPLREEERMVCSAGGGTVSAVSGYKNHWSLGFMDWVDISVTLYLPADYRGSLSLYSTSGTISAGSVIGDVLQVNSTSGSIQVSDSQAKELKIGSVSGAARVQGGEFDRVSADTVSGEVSLDAARMDSIRADTTSGAVNVSVGTMPGSIQADTVSGSVTLRLPENDGFTLDTDTVSGGVRCDFALAHDTYKDGGSEISVDTVSGSISIVKK